MINEIENDISNTLVTGTADDDSIFNYGEDVTIDAGKGNDTINVTGNEK